MKVLYQKYPHRKGLLAAGDIKLFQQVLNRHYGLFFAGIIQIHPSVMQHNWVVFEHQVPLGKLAARQFPVDQFDPFAQAMDGRGGWRVLFATRLTANRRCRATDHGGPAGLGDALMCRPVANILVRKARTYGGRTWTILVEHFWGVNGRHGR